MKYWLLLFFCLTLLVDGEDLYAQNSTKAAPDTIFKTVQVDEHIQIRGRRQYYKKRGNPAVELAESIIARRDKGDPYRGTNLRYTRHEKIVIAVDDFKLLDSTSKLVHLNQNTVVNPTTGRLTLPVSLKERIVSTTYKNGVQHEKEMLNQTFGIDEKLDNESVSAYLTTAMESIDVFTDYINFVQRRFMSPLARGAVGFYKFYLGADTTLVNGSPCVRLGFFPYNKDGLGLSGALYVRADSSLFVQRAELTMPRTADVNYVRDLNVVINYRLDSTGYRLIDSEDLNFGFSATNNSTALDARRTNEYVGYEFLATNIEQPKAPTPIVSRLATMQIDQVHAVSETLRRRPLFVIGEGLTIIATQGYLGTGRQSRFDIGPIFNFISGNELEGTRLSFGGMTTPRLMKRLFLEGYLAYGIGDNRWKYMAAAEWSFVNHKNHMREFPVHSLRLSYTDDVHKFGSTFGAASTDNVFSWLRRAKDNSLTYMRRVELTYKREFPSHFSFDLTARHYTDFASRVMSFAPGLNDYTMSELSLRLRYAPGEVIFQTKRRRYSMNRYAPVVEVNHTSSFAGILGSDYSSHITELSASYRINCQPLGYVDLAIKAGGQWSTVPYMLLPQPPTNLSYVVREGRFAMMHPMELLYDRYLMWDLSYYMDGLILSRIPLIKKLKVREVFTFRGVWGALSAKNNPIHNSKLPAFPTQSSPIGGEPYMEVGVGLENILNIFRVDYVWRLTYLDSKSTIRGGVLLSARFKF
ncbi:MAG: DUF5686 family protein [Mucinivorans sp.]